MDDEDDTAALVRRVRDLRGETQTAFAAALGVERHTISRYENGDFIPLTTLLAIKQLLAEYHDRRRHAKRERERRKESKRESSL